MKRTYHDPADPRISAMLDATEHCLHCGKPLKYLADKDARRNRGYCCYDHYLARPPRLAFACKTYGLPPAELLCSLLNTGATVDTVAGLLGVNKQALYAWMDKYGIRRVVQYVAGYGQIPDARKTEVAAVG